MIKLTTEAAQQIEEALQGVVNCPQEDAYWLFSIGEALATIRAARAQEQAEQDLDTCPGCGGVADNGYDREFPPNPYYCTKCTEQAEQEPVDGVLPCPFCGDNQPTVFEGSTFRWRVAVCNNCGAYAPEVRHDTLAEDQKQAGIESDAAAIVAWNTRAAPVRTKDLTDDEILAIAIQYDAEGGISDVEYGRRVIAAYKEKNK